MVYTRRKRYDARRKRSSSTIPSASRISRRYRQRQKQKRYSTCRLPATAAYSERSITISDSEPDLNLKLHSASSSQCTSVDESRPTKHCAVASTSSILRAPLKEPVVLQSRACENIILHYLAKLRNVWGQASSSICSVATPPKQNNIVNNSNRTVASTTGHNDLVNCNQTRHHRLVRKPTPYPSTLMPRTTSPTSKTNNRRMRNKSARVLDLDATSSSQMDVSTVRRNQAYHILNQALEYGLAQGIVAKSGNKFWLTHQFRDKTARITPSRHRVELTSQSARRMSSRAHLASSSHQKRSKANLLEQDDHSVLLKKGCNEHSNPCDLCKQCQERDRERDEQLGHESCSNRSRPTVAPHKEVLPTGPQRYRQVDGADNLENNNNLFGGSGGIGSAPPMRMCRLPSHTLKMSARLDSLGKTSSPLLEPSAPAVDMRMLSTPERNEYHNKQLKRQGSDGKCECGRCTKKWQ